MVAMAILVDEFCDDRIKLRQVMGDVFETVPASDRYFDQFAQNKAIQFGAMFVASGMTREQVCEAVLEEIEEEKLGWLERRDAQTNWERFKGQIQSMGAPAVEVTPAIPRDEPGIDDRVEEIAPDQTEQN